MKALFDTNILIDYLNAVPASRTELRRYNESAVSIITWMEIMAGADESVGPGTRAFLSSFDIIGLDQPVADRAVSLRRDHKIKLPDAIVWASAQTRRMLLVTRNTKDFPANDPSVRHPYVV